MSMFVAGSEIRRRVMEKLSAVERRTYQTSAWINGLAFAVAFVLLVGFVVLADQDLHGEDVVTSASPHAVTLVRNRK
jgi:hypothetical protein